LALLTLLTGMPSVAYSMVKKMHYKKLKPGWNIRPII
jgi:hypothetical protein